MFREMKYLGNVTLPWLAMLSGWEREVEGGYVQTVSLDVAIM